MRKGFLVTLATVAIALMGFNAMALAPTIKDIPDIIVGDAEDSSDANIFVAPDFLDVGNTSAGNELSGRYVEDDDTSPGMIIWSFATEGASRYLINGVGPQATTLGANLNQFVLPSNRLDDTDDDAAEADSDPRTLTIRDETLSPMAGTPPYPDPGNAGDVVGTQIVVLYASDGTTVSNPLEASGEKGMITIYSVEDAFDSFSPGGGVPVLGPLDLTAGVPTGWQSATEFGTVAITSVGGLCLETQLNVNGGGNWRSAYGDVELVKNCVYQLRLGVTTDATVGAQPLILIVYDNVNDAGTAGTNGYGGEMFLLDNEGGANSAIPGTGLSSDDGDIVKFWMMPPCFQVSYFQDETNGMFKPALAADKDMRIILRVLDTTAAGIGAEFDEGKICFTSVEVQRFDWADVVEVGSGYSDTTLTDAGNEWGVDDGLNSTVTFAGDNVTIGPTGDSWSTSAGNLVFFRPGDTTLDLNTPSTVPDNYPVPYEADTDYLIEYELSAPTETDVLNNPDVIRLGASPVTEEIVTDHFLTTNTPDSTSEALAARGVVMPRDGGPYKYAIIWNSLALTNSDLRASGTDVDRMRPRFEILNGTPFAPLGRTTNTGRIQINSVRVQPITF